MEIIGNLEHVIGNGERTIGAVVCWSLDRYLAPRGAFAKAIETAWPEAATALTRAPGAKAALKAAIDRASSSFRGAFVRPLARNGRYALIVEQPARESPDRLEMTHAWTLSADDTGVTWQSVANDQTDRTELRTRIDSFWREKRESFDSSELSTFLAALMNGGARTPYLAAYSLRERLGGVYFVPASTLPQLRAIKAAVESLSTGCRIQILTISGTSENLSEAADEASKSIGRHLAELREELEEFTAELQASRTMPDRHAVATRANRFTALDRRVQLYVDILGDVAGQLRSQIGEARKQLIGALEALA